MNFSGTWYNELVSEMNINFEDGNIIGEYHSKVGTAPGWYKLTGFYNKQAENNIAIGWVVVWANEDNNSHAVTTWSGELRYAPETGAKIYTTWLLTSETGKEEEWESTLIGKDWFTQSPPEGSSKPTIPSISHPMK